MILPKQSRAARGLLSWSQTQLAESAGLSLPTVKRFETENGANVANKAVEKIETAMTAAGIEFIPENGGGFGVRLAKKAQNK